MTNLVSLKENLQNLQAIGAVFSNNLHIILTITSDIFSHIKICPTIEVAQPYFKMLDMIQSTLAILVHEHDIEMPDNLWRFMSDFDNFEEAKKIYFDRIKTSKYVFK
jgi:hypothetical protein